MIMPEMDGNPVAGMDAAIRSGSPGHHGHGNPRHFSTALEAIRRGAYDYILKPFEKDQLFLGVGRALQHRRLIIENRNYQRNLEQPSSCAPRNSRKHVELEQSYDDTLEALGSALDLKDAETEGHCQRVTAFWHLHRQNHARAGSIFAHSGACRFPP